MAIALIEESELRRLIREEVAALLEQMRRSPVRDDLPPVLTVREAAEAARVSVYKMYDLTRRPGFPAVRDGRMIRIPRDALFQWLEREGLANDGQPCG